jgi:hypothetical protein
MYLYAAMKPILIIHLNLVHLHFHHLIKHLLHFNFHLNFHFLNFQLFISLNFQVLFYPIPSASFFISIFPYSISKFLQNFLSFIKVHHFIEFKIHLNFHQSHHFDNQDLIAIKLNYNYAF